MGNKTVIVIILIGIAIVCGAWFLVEYNLAQKEDEAYMAIQSEFITVQNTGSDTEEKAQAEGPDFVYPDFPSLLEQNKDTVGWVYIPGTEISYPVTQGSDNSRYLSRDFNGDRSSAGCVFMDSENNAHPLDKNTVLYGHNIRGRNIIFGPLISYKKQAYFEGHKIIQFDTVQKKYDWWEVFAVLHINYKTDDFKYLQLGFESGEEFMDWAKSAKSKSLYDTGTEVSEDDIVLVLSTCDRTGGLGKNGRLIVLAKQTAR